MLIDLGGSDTLSARDSEGNQPLHWLLQSHSGDMGLKSVKYMLQSNPACGVAKTLGGDLPVTLASATSPLNVLYKLLRANPGVVA